MGELLEHGGSPRAPRPRWAIAAVAVVVAVGGGYLVVHRDGILSSHPDAAPTGSPVSASPTPSVSESAQPSPAGRPWPEVAGACRNDIQLPLVDDRPLRARTGLRVLVGGHGLRSVDVDTGRVRPVPGTDVRRRQVTLLVRAGNAAYALAAECGARSPIGRVLRVGRATAPAPGLAQAESLIAGDGRVWGFRYGTRPGEGIRLHPADRVGGSVLLPPAFAPVGVARGRFVGSVSRGLFPDDLPQLALVDTVPPRRLRTLGRGYPLSVTRGAAWSYGPCGSGQPCALIRTSLSGAGRRTYPLPRGSAPASEPALSRDGRTLAMLVSREGLSTGFQVGHPGPPLGVLVLDLATGATQFVPGLVLAAKSYAGLALSDDGSWLVVSLNEGNRTRLLVWRGGMDRPARSPAALPGRVLYGAPLLVDRG